MYFDDQNLDKISYKINRTLKISGFFISAINLLRGEIALKNQPIPLELGLDEHKFNVSNLYQIVIINGRIGTLNEFTNAYEFGKKIY